MKTIREIIENETPLKGLSINGSVILRGYESSVRLEFMEYATEHLSVVQYNDRGKRGAIIGIVRVDPAIIDAPILEIDDRVKVYDGGKVCKDPDDKYIFYLI